MKPVYVIMGVSGCGKTTIGQRLAQSLGIPFYDADFYHPQENVEKMSNGVALTDYDRVPWLHILNSEIRSWQDGDGGVLACSALKESYREILTKGNELQWIVLNGSFETIFNRLKERSGHYMPESLLQSQFDALEIPEYGIYIEVEKSVDEVVSAILKNLKQPRRQLGIIGLGVMGRELARNMLNNELAISVYNRTEGNEQSVVQDFLHYVKDKPVSGFTNLQAFVDSLAIPRKILMMVPAGEAVDQVISSLSPLLSENDILIDAGNSYYKDTEQRATELKHLHYFGIGVSGGAEGALKGPSLMVGGPKEAYDAIAPYLKLIAAKDSKEKPCLAYFGNKGAGHFVKMVHNGIEYAEMQLLAEIFALLKPNCSYEKIAEILLEWNSTSLQSYLLEITIAILQYKEKSDYLLDKIVDKATGKGTGMWSAKTSLQLGVSASMMQTAVEARYISMLKEKRLQLDTATLENNVGEIETDGLAAAYAFARLINHYQGFELIKKASEENQWNIDLSEVARVWTNGCIIKSELMTTMVSYFQASEDLLNINAIAFQLSQNEKHNAQVLKYALENRIPTPALSTAMQYWMAMSTGTSTANLIQAQRDYFGAHGYRRKDIERDELFSTNWKKNNG